MRRKRLAAAISLALAGSAGALLNTAQAVHINPDGVGEVLVYPYYTVRQQDLGQTDSLISVVNTTDTVKAVKVRFLEGKRSQEVLDFNLYLSPFDVWTGVITRSDEGAALSTSDNSCTVPPIPAGGVEFRNLAYTGSQGDGEDQSLDRTREGYIELIEMGVVDDTFSSDIVNFTPEQWATHDSSGFPDNCDAINAAWTPPAGTWLTPPLFENDAIISDPSGLFGGVTLVNVSEGTAAGYDAIALDSFLNGESRPTNTITAHTEPGLILPSLAVADPESVVFVQGGVVASTWLAQGITGNGAGASAVSAVFMRNRLFNEFVTGGIADARTGWVVTFPTKKFHVGVDILDEEFDYGPPFTEDFGEGGACEEVGITAFGREEEEEREDLDFSPQPPGGRNVLCWEVNVVTYNGTDATGSDLRVNINTIADNGWADFSFFPITGLVSDFEQRPGEPYTIGHTLVSDQGQVYEGLPVVGFAVQEFVNGNVGGEAGVLSNYDGLFNHAYGRQISSGTP